MLAESWWQDVSATVAGGVALMTIGGVAALFRGHWTMRSELTAQRNDVEKLERAIADIPSMTRELVTGLQAGFDRLATAVERSNRETQTRLTEHGETLAYLKGRAEADR